MTSQLEVSLPSMHVFQPTQSWLRLPRSVAQDLTLVAGCRQRACDGSGASVCTTHSLGRASHLPSPRSNKKENPPVPSGILGIDPLADAVSPRHGIRLRNHGPAVPLMVTCQVPLCG